MPLSFGANNITMKTYCIELCYNSYIRQVPVYVFNVVVTQCDSVTLTSKIFPTPSSHV